MICYKVSVEVFEPQRVRAVTLDAVLEGFGAQRDLKDPEPNRCRSGSRLTVMGGGFCSHSERRAKRHRLNGLKAWARVLRAQHAWQPDEQPAPDAVLSRQGRG